MGKPIRISYAFMAVLLILVGVLQLATPLITALFAYFALNLLSFNRSRWIGLTLFLLLLSALGVGFYSFVKHAYVVLPQIAEKTIPAVVELAQKNSLELPFTDLASLKVTALDMVVGLLPISLHPSLAAARRDIGEGRSISAAFETHGLTTAVSLRLLRVAERTGQMGEMLERTAGFHEEDISQSIEWFIRLFEPLLMIVMGVVIGVVVLLMYAPIFELAGSIQ
jgi:type II secretory pathway component PulF